MDTAAIQRLIPELFRITAELEAAAPGRHFTPDGHLVGSIGEVIAAARYGLTLTTASTKGVDAHDSNGRSIEIKATLGSRGVALRGLDPEAEHLLVLRVNSDGSADEVFNGPAQPAWQAAGKIQSNGQRIISLSRLASLQTKVTHEQMLLKSN